VLYSIVSVVLGALLASLAASLENNLWNMPPFDVRLVFGSTLFTSAATLLLCLPGWLLALPILLKVTDFSRWRFLIFLAVGTALGPTVILAIFVVDFIAAGRTDSLFSIPAGLMEFATIVASLVTLIYLLLIRFDQRRAHRRQADNATQSDPTPQPS
jgi:hypothetical protein